MKKLLLLTILTCSAITFTYGQEVNTARIDSFLNHIEKHNQGIGTVAVSKANQTVYTRSFGQTNLSDKHSSEPFRYRIGSITKLMTATLVMQLAEQGKLNLNETIETYFPRIPHADQITLAHLLNHTSGLGSYITKQDSLFFWTIVPVSEQEIMQEIERQGTLFEPGTNTQYSNSGYYLLTKIIEKKYNKKYPEIVQEKILKPLGLKQTASGIIEDATIAPSYYLSTNHSWERSRDFYFPNVIGLGDIASTPEELNRFTTALFTGRLLRQESVVKMKPSKSQLFGLGVLRVPFYQKILYGHTGDTFGTRSIALYNEEDSLAIALSINGGSMPFNDLLIGIMSGAYNLPCIYPDFSQYGTYVVPLNSLTAYEGTYKLPTMNVHIRIYREGDNLMAQMTGQPPFCLEAFSKDVFKYSPSDVTIEFKTAEKQFILKQFGRTTLFAQ